MPWAADGCGSAYSSRFHERRVYDRLPPIASARLHKCSTITRSSLGEYVQGRQPRADGSADAKNGGRRRQAEKRGIGEQIGDRVVHAKAEEECAAHQKHKPDRRSRSERRALRTRSGAQLSPPLLARQSTGSDPMGSAASRRSALALLVGVASPVLRRRAELELRSNGSRRP